MKVLVRNYTDTARIRLDLPAIPQKGEYLTFSLLEGLEDLTPEEEKLAEESTAFLLADEEDNAGGCPCYVVTSRTFHNNGVVELWVRSEERV